MGVPYTFADALGGSNLPLEWLDDNFAYLTSSPSFSGNVTITGTLGVVGAVTFSSTLNVAGITTLSNDLSVAGSSSFTGVTTLLNSVSIAGPLTVGTQQTAQGSLVLANTSAGAYSTTIKSSNFSSTAWTLTLPPTAGTNGYILTTDGFGFSAWTNPTALGIDLDVGSTAITAGATGRVLYDNAGVLGEYSLVPLSVGGTNANLTASNGGIFYSTASAAAILSGTATANQLLISGSSSAPSWTTATYPPTTTINQILYSSANNTVTGLATANGGILNANSSGVPSMTVTPTLGVQQTTQGRLILANTAAGAFQTTVQSSNSASAAWTLTLPTTAGTNNYVLTTNGSGVSSWSQVSLTAGVTGTLPTTNGGTGITGFTAANRAIYSTSASALTAGILPIAAGGTGISSLTTGYIPFGGTSTFSSDSALFWDNTGKRLGVGTSVPVYKFDVAGDARVQKPAGAGWGIVTNTNGSANESGVYFDSLNNAILIARDGAGTEQVRWHSDGDNYGNLVDGKPAFVCRAWVNFDGTSNTANLSGTYSQSGFTVTVTATAHGLVAGSSIYSNITSGTAVSGLYNVDTVIDANTFTYTAGTSLTTSGNITLVRSTIRGSGNVTSVTDFATGQYRVNLTTALPDANAAVVSSCEITGNFHENTNSWMITTVEAGVETRNANTLTDAQFISVAIFR